MKSLDDNFSDWEASVFGFGYGSGEPHIIPALKRFLAEFQDGSYDYRNLEKSVGETVAWLLINALCRASILEYGTSPRFGWLTKEGKALKEFIDSKTEDQLIEMACRDSSYVGCYPDACNCGPDGYEEGKKCVNPFWLRR